MSETKLPALPTPAPSPISEQEIADVARAAIDAARRGDMYGAEVARRLWRESRRTAIALDLPAIEDAAGIDKAQAAVIEAAAAGRLAPREALAFSTMIEHRRRSLETHKLEEDLRQMGEAMAEQRRNERRSR